MNEQPKVSILCCTYNNARWIRECFESLINQTERDIEILIGDDGSNDPEAVAIIDEYVAKDDRIILDRHENMGCGATLNRLLDRAKGQYIAEIDSDDAFELNAIETMLSYAEDGRIELVKCSYTAILPAQEVEVKLWTEEQTRGPFRPSLLSMNESLAYLRTTPAMWCAIYLREWLLKEGIRWEETPGALYQDTSFSLKARIYAHRVRVTNDLVYRYNLMNEASSTKKTGNFCALTNEYKSVEKMLRRRPSCAWPIFTRIKFGSYMWMLTRVDDIENALMQMRQDLMSDIFERSFYTEEELQLIDSFYGKRLG